MGLYVTGISNVNNLSNRQSKTIDGIPVYMQGNGVPHKKINKSNDGKFSFSEAAKNFAKGIISPVTSMFSSPMNFLIGTGMIAGSVLLIGATGGAAAPVLIASGIGIGAFESAKATYKVIKAKNGDDVEKAFFNFGVAATSIGLSASGAKGSLKQASIESEGLNVFGATKKCLTSAKELFMESLEIFKSGYYKTNLSNMFKFVFQPKNMRKYSKELCKKGQENFETSFNALKEALPEEFQGILKGRAKSEISIYEKILKEKTTVINENIKTIQSDKTLSPEIKQQKIGELLKRRKQIQEDANYAKSLISDLLGSRLILEDMSSKNIDRLIAGLVDSIKKGKIEITEIENYCGMNELYPTRNDFYFSDAQINKLRKVSPNMNVRNAYKSSGYTAVQLKIRPKGGEVIELQIRGSKVDSFAELEHITYDLRQGKDTANGDNKAGILLTKVQEAIKKLTDKQYKSYQKYIYDNYIYAQAQELGKEAVKPPLPEGIDPILSCDGLHNLREQIKAINPSQIKTPFDLFVQMVLVPKLDTTN